MALRKPLVIVAGQVQQLQAGDSLDVQADAFTQVNGEATAIVIGAPVYNDAAGSVKKAQANAAATKDVIGLVGQAPSIAAGQPGAITVDAMLTASTAQWDAVTGGSGGLVFKTRYYLDPATAGKLTSTAPTTVGQYVVEVGIAMSTTDLKIDVKAPILL